MMQLWQASNQMVSWLKPDSEDTQCSPYEWTEDADLGEVEEFSGVGTLVVITVLGCLFIWFSFMPRRHCGQNSTLQCAREAQREQHSQQQPLQQQPPQQQPPQQQMQQTQHAVSILHIELKQDKMTINAVDVNPDNWQDLLPKDDNEIQKLCLNLNAIHRLSTKDNMPCTSAAKHIKPLQLEEQQLQEKGFKSLVTSKMFESERYHDLPVEDHEAEYFMDLLSEESDNDRFVDTLDN